MKEEQLIKACLKNDRVAQKEFYKTFASKMYGVCLRYVKDKDEAADILQDSFIKVFEKLHTYRFDGSLEGWIRRVVVNTALNYLKKKQQMEQQEVDIDTIEDVETVDADAISKLSQEDIIRLIQELPTGKRTVFNLYVYEGYSHKEIGEILQISENTSKGQFAKAKKILQEKIEQLHISKYGKIYQQ